jgi:hypothetical protein
LADFEVTIIGRFWGDPQGGIHRTEVVSAKEYADELGWDTSYV